MNNYQRRIAKSNKTILCFAYQDDLDATYSFYCARYENISYDEFLQLGFFEFKKKLNSIPKDEPLFERIKARTINLSKIKNKDERDYWKDLKRVYEIPQIYLSSKENDIIIKNMINSSKLGGF